ncbi:MAG: nucleotidyltransferase family protein [Holophaga sp.]|jgi:dTDP-glucose pyrophosphorylase/CBS domain-containing protein
MNLSFLKTLQISPDASLRDLVACIDRSGRISIALLVDELGRLINVITDGDVRRGLLAGKTLDTPTRELLPIKKGMPNPEAVTAPAGTHPMDLLALMQSKHVRQVPLLNAGGSVVDMALLSDLLPQPSPDLSAVIMAGGFGTRLRPMTDDTPKPMLPLGGRPVLEWMVHQLRMAGIFRMKVTTHYLPEKIMDHFGDGTAFGVEIEYVNEDQPLGTGGALGLIDGSCGPLLVVNGDVVTRVDFHRMLDFHLENEADMTVAVNLRRLEVPFGVVDCDGPRIKSLQEKPHLPMLVNAGIYLLQPSVQAYIPRSGRPFNMTDLIQWLLDAGRNVVGFPIREYWTDIGQHDAYARAQEDHARTWIQ